MGCNKNVKASYGNKVLPKAEKCLNIMYMLCDIEIGFEKSVFKTYQLVEIVKRFSEIFF